MNADDQTKDTTDALRVGDIKMANGAQPESVILSPDGVVLSKRERDLLIRKAKSAIGLLHEVVNSLESLK